MSATPNIRVEDVCTRPWKRRRLEPAFEGIDSGPANRWVQVLKHDVHSAVVNISSESSSTSEIEEVIEPVKERTVVCFGMVINLHISVPSHSREPPYPIPMPAYLDSDGKTCRRLNGALIGTLDSHAAETLSTIKADGDFEMQMFSSMPVESGQSRRKQAAQCLSIILYGPKCRADDVGDFLDQCGYYLQEPSGCDRNVPYCNPQCLSPLDGVLPMTLELHNQQYHAVDEFVWETKDVLSHFETTELFDEPQTPTALRTRLHA